MGAMRRFGSDGERRRRRANALYEFEMLLREEGISDFVYDEEKDLFRFPDGRFAFSREWAPHSGTSKRGPIFTWVRGYTVGCYRRYRWFP
jgi:hypothetical protein